AHGHEDPLDFELLAAEIDDDARATGLHRRYLDAGLHGDPAPGERPRQLLRDVFILDGYNARERLEQGHLDAVRRVDVGELDADRAGADDGDRPRRRLATHGAVRGDDRLLVDGHARQRLRLRAGGQDDGARLEPLDAARPLHVHDVFRLERAPTREQGDLVLAEQELDALRHPVGHAPAPLDRLGIAGLEPVDADPEVGGMAQEVDHLRVPQQSLGRDAAPVQAHAARAIVLDSRDREAELRAADGRDVAARTGADHHNIELVRRHRPRPASATALRATA